MTLGCVEGWLRAQIATDHVGPGELHLARAVERAPASSRGGDITLRARSRSSAHDSADDERRGTTIRAFVAYSAAMSPCSRATRAAAVRLSTASISKMRASCAFTASRSDAESASSGAIVALRLAGSESRNARAIGIVDVDAREWGQGPRRPECAVLEVIQAHEKIVLDSQR